MIWELLSHAKSELNRKDFKEIICNVHVSNRDALKIYTKIGFSLEVIPNNNSLLRVHAGKEIFENRIFDWFEKRNN